MSTIYVLELVGGKYYVGKSDRVDARIQDHGHGKGSSWTRVHRPVKVYGTYPCLDAFDEDLYTYRMMDMFGEDNVRGGSYCELVLSQADRKNIRTKIASANNACLKCYEKGHFATKCTAVFDKYGDRIVAPSVCTKCLNEGHEAEKCIAKCDKNGILIPLNQQYTSSTTTAVASPTEIPSISRKRSLEPTPVSTSPQLCMPSKQKLATKPTGTASKPSPAALGACRRCGRDSHWEADCYASTDADGRRLKDKKPSVDSITSTTSIPSTSTTKKDPAAKESKPAPIKKQSAGSGPSCARCGRENHSAGSCYAGTDVNGKKLSK